MKARATRGKPREHRINLSPDHWSNTHLTTLNIDFDNQESSSSLQPNESSQSPESSSTPKSVLDVLAAAGFDASTYPNHHTIYGLPSPMEHYPPYRLNILFDALSSQCNYLINQRPHNNGWLRDEPYLSAGFAGTVICPIAPHHARRFFPLKHMLVPDRRDGEVGCFKVFSLGCGLISSLWNVPRRGGYSCQK